jgi:DNA helicase-2/ATP-dependent DNA helicase PcrA
LPLSRLNPEQSAAARAPLGYNLIIASAGTGKTSAIVGRIAHLLSQGVRAREILLLTFTNKAAGEMTARIAASFGKEAAQEIMSGTFHSVAYKWLKSLNKNIVLKQPAELKTLFKSVYDKQMAAEFNRAGLRENLLSAPALYDYQNLFENSAQDDFGEFLAAKNPAHKANAPLYEAVCGEFRDLKTELGFVGFNDLLIAIREALSDPANAAERARYLEVLVDEYQDTNPLQNSVLETIAPRSLFAVGDYDQSIYAFNGAEIGIIASFERRYAGAKVWTLTKNYRSTALILSLANRVIAHNERIYPKNLEVVKSHSPREPQLLIFGDLYEQYRVIAARIGESRFERDQTAVLFRNNSSADGIEAMLRELAIPCKRRGGNSFFESREIKALLDILILLINPHDILAFIHILEYAKGIGAGSAKDIFDACARLGGGNMLRGFLSPDPNAVAFEKNKVNLFGDLAAKKTFNNLPKNFENHPILSHQNITENGAKFLSDFHSLLSVLISEENPQKSLNIILRSEIFNLIAETLAKQRAIDKNKTLDQNKFEEAKERIFVKAETLKQLAAHYASRERFINAMALGGGEMSEGSGVNLLSVHAAKGLEFDEVFVIDLMDGRFPNRKLMNQGGAIEEERRLFYVAVTRARESLYLSFAQNDAYKNINYAPSLFLYEAGLLEKKLAKNPAV